MELLKYALRSDEYIYLDKPIKIHIGVIRDPLVEGRNKPLKYVFNELDDLHSSKSTVKVATQDNLCLARSMVIAHAKAYPRECKADNRSRSVVKSARIRYYGLINKTG